MHDPLTPFRGIKTYSSVTPPSKFEIGHSTLTSPERCVLLLCATPPDPLQGKEEFLQWAIGLIFLTLEE